MSRLIRTDYAERMSEYLVHTGQHYDANMSQVFFDELEIPKPDINLEVGSGSHGRSTGEMLARVEEVLLQQKPDVVLVYGDTNSTLAGALAASKLNIPVAHVEAGLRSFNRRMPEEQNRVLTDHLAALLFAPTETALRNLRAEGITDGVHNVGDVMYDAALHYRDAVEARGPESSARHRLGIPDRYVLATIHRAENTDDARRLRDIVSGLNDYTELEIVLPLHPRTKKALAGAGLSFAEHVHVLDPIGYLDMIELEVHAEGIVTDSGGVQKEAFFFGKPCITVRDETEWIETVESGWNRLVRASTIDLARSMRNGCLGREQDSKPFGDGEAGRKINEILVETV